MRKQWWCIAAIALALTANVGLSQEILLMGVEFETPRLATINQITGEAMFPRVPWPGPVVAVAGMTFKAPYDVYALVYTESSTSAAALGRLDMFTGNYVTIGPLGINSVFEGDLDFNPVNGKLYGMSQSFGTQPSVSHFLFEINPLTGAASNPVQIGLAGQLTDPSAMAFAADGSLYILDARINTSAVLFQVNPSTGGLIRSVTLPTTFNAAAGMDFHPATGLLYFADDPILSNRISSGSMHTFDIHTGLYTRLGFLGTFGIAGLTFIPEPSSAMLLFAATALLTRNCRRHSPIP